MLQEAAACEGRKFTSLGDAGDFFEEPPHLRVVHGPVCNAWDTAGDAGEVVDARHQPLVQVQAVRANIGCLGFEHHFGHIDVGGAFDAAHMAVNA